MIPSLLLLTVQLPGPTPLDLDPRPPVGAELRAAERRERRRFPLVLKVCRDAVRDDDLEAAVARFADENGLSTFARLALVSDCRLYRQGLRDGAAAK